MRWLWVGVMLVVMWATTACGGEAPAKSAAYMRGEGLVPCAVANDDGRGFLMVYGQPTACQNLSRQLSSAFAYWYVTVPERLPVDAEFSCSLGPPDKTGRIEVWNDSSVCGQLAAAGWVTR